jgi:hypothetical protein
MCCGGTSRIGRGPDGVECAVSAGADPGRNDRRLHRAQVGAAKRSSIELPELEVLLKETLGVIVYQEQVMQIANVLAGYSLGDADLLRRAMGKKDAEEMAKQRERFMSPARRRRSIRRTRLRRNLRPDGAVRGVWLQQVALGGVCAAGVPHGVSEDALSDRVYGGAADLETRSRRTW